MKIEHEFNLEFTLLVLEKKFALQLVAKCYWTVLENFALVFNDFNEKMSRNNSRDVENKGIYITLIAIYLWKLGWGRAMHLDIKLRIMSVV